MPNVLRHIPSLVSEIAGAEAVANKGAISGYAGLDGMRRLSQELPAAPPPCIKRIAGCQVDETWSQSNCTITADTADYVHGNQSIQMAVNSGANATATCALPFGISARGAAIGIWLKVDDLAKVGHIIFDIYESDTKSYRATLKSTSPVYPHYMVNNTWALHWIPRHNFATGYGTPTAWATGAVGGVDEYPIVKVRLQVIAESGQTPIVHIGSVLAQDYPKAAVIFHFDDARADVLTNAYPLLAAKGWPGNIGIYRQGVGTGSLLSAAQIQTLYAAGWDVMNHSDSHPGFTSSTTLTALLTEIERGQRYLRSQGWHRGSQFYVAPGNNTDYTGRDAVTYVAKFHAASRASITRSAAYPTSADVQGTCCPWIPKDRYNMAYCGLYESTYAAAVVQLGYANVRRCLLIPYTHGVYNDPDAVSVSVTYFSAFLEAIQDFVTAGTMEVITMSQWWDRTFGSQYFNQRAAA